MDLAYPEIKGETSLDMKRLEWESRIGPLAGLIDGGFKFPKPAMDAWLAALRDGTREQGHQILHIFGRGSRPAKFCCIGVYADAVLGCMWDSHNYPALSEGGTKLGRTSYLYHDYLPDALQRLLAVCNDRLGWNFNRVADWLEANIPTEE